MTSDDDRTIRASGRPADPAIPRRLRQELVKELAAAQQLVEADPDAASLRVRDAEVALGEPASGDPRLRLAAAMRALLWHRRPEVTICPSDAARIAGGAAWRDLMGTAREVAGELARAGVLSVRQQGVEVDVSTAVGPVRLARGPAWGRETGGGERH